MKFKLFQDAEETVPPIIYAKDGSWRRYSYVVFPQTWEPKRGRITERRASMAISARRQLGLGPNEK